MQDVKLYADLLVALSKWAHLEVEGLSAAELAWQPDSEGNSIAVTVWHVSRWLDVTARLLQGKSPGEELWLTRGWAERTSYNPQGIGMRGLGVVTWLYLARSCRDTSAECLGVTQLFGSGL